ncbi:MAG: DUF5107 domain-containing protein [Bacteroidota bacterium]
MKINLLLLVIPCFLWGNSFYVLGQESGSVHIWEEDLVLPTYLVDPPEKCPMFFKNDSYQGASRKIYPYPLEDDFTGKKGERTYRAVYLENEYLKVCVLPEIGGRLFYTTDKTNGYEIFYRQSVIKPAHIGMLGAWISGGIEFCVFHHHRATTNMPVDYDLVENEDGSVTLWMGETELRHRMKWTFGISLFPGKSYLELDGRLINSTENTNSILYWANVATSVNEDYQIIFPPSTEFAVFHAKNSFSHWPVTQEAYRGNPYYENQIDASWWRNHPGQNSFFAHEIQEGFLAGYDHGKQAGTMLVGNPHIVKGAKLWEWGKGSYWDTHVLTDTDGPYAEVMSGAYSDNQPDYSWLKPYEYKVFKQYWYPMRDSKGAASANLNGLLNLTMGPEGGMYLAANTTAAYEGASIVLRKQEETLYTETIHISPASPYQATINVSGLNTTQGLTLDLLDAAGELLVSYSPQAKAMDSPLPDPVEPPLPPSEITSIEDVYLTGLRIKQFHNARIDPLPYFQEALKRDPLDTRSHLQMGIHFKENGEFPKAASHFRKALIRLTKNYTRPRDCEAFYHLGLILKAQGKLEAAYDTLYRAAWDHAFTAPAYFHLAQISVQKGAYEQALVELDRCLMNNASHLNALHLKAAILRKMGEREAAGSLLTELIEKDPLNFAGWNEQALLSDASNPFKKLNAFMRDQPENYLELALQYLHAGLLDESLAVLNRAISSSSTELAQYPIISYYLGFIHHMKGNASEAHVHFSNGSQYPIDYCFPHRWESRAVLETALDMDATDSRAYYYLGNLLYDKQPMLAMEFWEKAVAQDPNFAMAYRNLGWGYFRTLQDLEKAITAYERAVAIDSRYPRFFIELDRLYERNGTEIDKRNQLILNHRTTLAQHSSALVREALVANAAKDYDRSINVLTQNYFNRQEGRSGLHDIYVDACLLKAKALMKEKKWQLALESLEAADLYPENQSIGRDEESERRAQIFFYRGFLANQMGKADEANSWFKKALEIKVDEPEYAFQQALALQNLGKQEEAAKVVDNLAQMGQHLLEEERSVDFFSKFGGEESMRLRKAKANYLLGLSAHWQADPQAASAYYQKALDWNPGHAWARSMLSEVQ